MGWFKSKSGRAEAPEPAENPLPYEVGEFSIKHGLSILEARRILGATAGSREDADAAADAVRLRRVLDSAGDGEPERRTSTVLGP